MPLLEISGLTVQVDGQYRRRILDDVSIFVGEGEIVGIEGPSGSGKTMLALAAMGMLPAQVGMTSGKLTFAGDALPPLIADRPAPFRNQKLNIIFQEAGRNFNPTVAVGPQIAAPLLVRHNLVERDVFRDQVNEVLARLGFMDPRRIYDARPKTLSSGELQRCLLASAFLCPTAMLIVDEPTSSLDRENADLVCDWLLALNKTYGTALMVISHDRDVIARMSHRRFSLENGKLFTTQNTPVNRKPPAYAAPKQPTGDGAALQVHNLSKSFPSGKVTQRKLLHDVTLCLYPGETICITGPSGCGKTTFLRMIMNLVPRDGGMVEVTDRVIKADASPQDVSRSGMSMVWQDPIAGLNPMRTIGKQIWDAVQPAASQQGHAGIQPALRAAHLSEELLNRWPSELSGGQCQRASIARALAAAPRVMLMDEPFAFLDHETKYTVLESLLQWCRETGMAMLMVSHDVEVVRAFGLPIFKIENGLVAMPEKGQKNAG